MLHTRFQGRSGAGVQSILQIAQRALATLKVATMPYHLTRALVLSVAVCAAVQPASAKSWSFTITPEGDAAKVIGIGMKLYGLSRDLKNRAKTRQSGEGNGAAISQSGRGNTAIIVQRGSKNSGTITQTGNWNSYGLFQFGRRNSADVVQSGTGQVGLTFQGDW